METQCVTCGQYHERVDLCRGSYGDQAKPTAQPSSWSTDTSAMKRWQLVWLVAREDDGSESKPKLGLVTQNVPSFLIVWAVGAEHDTMHRDILRWCPAEAVPPPPYKRRWKVEYEQTVPATCFYVAHSALDASELFHAGDKNPVGEYRIISVTPA